MKKERFNELEESILRAEPSRVWKVTCENGVIKRELINTSNLGTPTDQTELRKATTHERDTSREL